MPLQVMNESLYADRTFQDWHRSEMPTNADAIDLDLFGVCHRGSCRDPLYLVESTTRSDKPCSILRRLAQRAQCFALIVQHDTVKITDWRVVHEPVEMSRNMAGWDKAQSLRDYLERIRVLHENKTHAGR